MRFLLLFPLSFLLLLMWSMISYSHPQDLKFRHLTTEDGLPPNSLFHVIKNSHGMIWITTTSGLCRYDGYDIKIYQYNYENSDFG